MIHFRMKPFRMKPFRMNRARCLRYPFMSSLFTILVTDASRLWAQEDMAAESEAPAGLMGIIFSGGIVGAIMIFILLAIGDPLVVRKLPQQDTEYARTARQLLEDAVKQSDKLIR